MQGPQAASQETCLLWSPIDQPGCAERAEHPEWRLRRTAIAQARVLLVTGVSDPLAVAKTARLMELRGIGAEAIHKVVYGNVLAVYGFNGEMD